MKFIALVVVIAFSVTSCASLINGTTQNVGISSNPSGAKAMIDKNMEITTPVTVLLSRKSNHVIEVRKEGYEDASVAISQSPSGWLAANILIFGFGIIIGGIIDFVSGGAYKLTPSDVTVDLKEVKK